VSRPRVAFVVQRCGDEVVGGAESLCLQVAHRLRTSCEVEILTTCALDYQTWRNEYPGGHCYVGDVHVRRFPVDRPRDTRAFDKLSRDVEFDIAGTTLERQEEWMRAQGPMSSQLFAYLRDYEQLYDVIVFYGYLYATTYFGLPLVARKAILVPLAHDEWPIRLSMFEKIFAAPRELVFSTEEEREFVRRRFPNLALRGDIISVGIEAPSDRNPERFRRRYNIDEPFLLYLGRIEKSKGVDVLFEDFIRYREARRAPKKLVLVGREHTAIPKHPDIVMVGQVDEQEKWDALAACDALVMPSQFESLSLVLLEAWACGKPVVVNARSSVLVGQCRRAQGGIWYDSYEEFEVALDLLDRDLRQTLGRQGQEHVWNAYNWEQVLLAYRALFDALFPGPSTNGSITLYDERTDQDARPQPKTHMHYG
jgi:glycosyltransferase involved in cell wall biosynthesis